MEREKFKSRLGFILISAGCAIGIGNVWRFPYVAGKYGGGAFVLFYLVFLILVGVPIMTMEFAIGRASRKSVICAYKELEKPGQRWHIHGYFALLGNYLLMMFYTSVAGWMVNYFFKFATGAFEGMDTEKVGGVFSQMLSNPLEMTFWMIAIVVFGFFICSKGLQNGVERVTKGMMIALLVLIGILAIHSMMLPGSGEGLKFYLVPDFTRMAEAGIFDTIVAAMNQSFFTLSLGIGAMTIFGSYMDKSHTLLGESVQIAILDTVVALVAGLIIFPACFSFGVNPDSGPSLIFITLPNVFLSMTGGRIWGTLFFLFMSFAAFSTIIAVFENILSCCIDTWGMSRKKASILNLVILLAASMPCVLGFNVWSGFQPLGAGSGVLDLEDFLVSNLLLPIGSIFYLLFCVTRVGWGFENFRKEANCGKGMQFPKWMRIYVTFVLPLIVLFLLLEGLFG